MGRIDPLTWGLPAGFDVVSERVSDRRRETAVDARDPGALAVVMDGLGRSDGIHPCVRRIATRLRGMWFVRSCFLMCGYRWATAVPFGHLEPRIHPQPR